jgi:hypothetical protein
MRGAALFARSRSWLVNVVVILASGALMLACGPLSYALNPSRGYLVEVASQLPIIASITIQASLATPLFRQEGQSARAVGNWRLLHLLIFTVLGVIVFGVVGTQLHPPAGVLLQAYAQVGSVGLARNLFALTGAALVGASVLGPRLGWTLPFAWAILPFFALSSPSADSTGLLTLVAQPDDAFGPFIAALIVLIVGLVLATKGWGVSRRMTA